LHHRKLKYVVATDDVASSPKETKEKRHGIAGGYFMWKVGGFTDSRNHTRLQTDTDTAGTINNLLSNSDYFI
jgi:dihydroxyacetone kinase